MSDDTLNTRAREAAREIWEDGCVLLCVDFEDFADDSAVGPIAAFARSEVQAALEELHRLFRSQADSPLPDDDSPITDTIWSQAMDEAAAHTAALSARWAAETEQQEESDGKE